MANWNQKIGDDAFEFYATLPRDKRSYQAVADRYGVSKQRVVIHAVRGKWQARLAVIEAAAAQEVDDRATETIAAMRSRHLAAYRRLQDKALSALDRIPMETAGDVVRALKMALDGERVIRGDPTERTAVEFDARTEREALILSPGQDDEWDDEQPAPSDGAVATA